MLYDRRKEREGEKNSKSTFGGIYHSDLIPRSPKEKQQENIVVRPNFNFRSLLTVPQASPPIQAKSAEIPANESVKEEVTVNEPIIQEKSDDKQNLTGLPDDLKAGVENLSGYSLDDVRVHYNSSKPAQLQALAYTQGTEIHVGPGQEKHLPHEAWHVVQQAQGRVQPTIQMKDGVSVNDDTGLEHEADVMGAKALVDAGELRVMQEAQEGVQDTFAPVQRMEWEHRAHLMQSYARASTQSESTNVSSHPVLRAIKTATASTAATPIQRRVGFEFEMGDIRTQHWGFRAGWHDHTKGYVMSTLQGYKLTADQGVGNSQLEVIIDPIDETNPVAVNNLINVTGPAVVNTIDNIAQGTHNVWTPANQIAGVNGSSWDRYRSDSSNAAGIMGQLQMTAGIDMNKLHAHATGQQAKNYLATLTTLNPNVNQDDATAYNTLNVYTTGPITATATNATNAIHALGGLTQPQRNQIAAIAALMATFPINMRTGGELPYPKAAAGPILARTDFSRIMMTLPDAAKNALTPAIMQQIVLATINGVGLPLIAPVVGADPVIPLGANLQNNPPALNQLSINDWVAGIVPTRGTLWGHWQGKDLLTRRNFPGNAQQREQMESMGSYGNRVDAGNKPIMEFRSLNGVFVPDLPGQLERLVAFLNH